MNNWLNEYVRFQGAYPALGGWMLCVMKTSAIVLMAAGAAGALQRQSARSQNWVWRSAIAVLLLLMVWQAVPTDWSIFTWKAAPATTTSPVPMVHPAADGVALTADVQMTQANLAATSAGPTIVSRLESSLLSVWAATAGALVLWQVARLIGSSRWLARNSSRLEADAAHLNVEIRTCPQLSTPVLTGLLRPKIFLPQSAVEWESEKREYVYAHELAHWSRSDLAWQLVGILTCCLWWWNPLVWIAFRQLKSTAEQATDDLVILQQGAPRDYARCLVEIASGRTNEPAMAMSVPMLGRSSLEKRIRRILSMDHLRNTFGILGAGLLGMLLVMTVLCAGTHIAMGEAGSQLSAVPHFNAKLANNVLPQGVFVKSGGKLEGWTGTLSAASFPEKGFVRIKAATEEAVLETKIARQSGWDWLTLMARTRPAPNTTLSEHQGAISVTELDGSGKPIGTPLTFEQSKRSGYVNWGNRIGTFQVSPEAKEIVVRIQLAPGTGQLDCSEIYLVPSSPADELDSAVVDRFYKSVKENDVAAVKQQLANEPRLANARNGSGDNGTPLIVCAWNELPEMAQVLIDAGADVKAVDSNWKSTALTWCGWWGSPKTAEVLLKAGSDPKFKSVYGVTPLVSAKAGKDGNKFSKKNPEDFDRVIQIFEKAN